MKLILKLIALFMSSAVPFNVFVSADDVFGTSTATSISDNNKSTQKAQISAKVYKNSFFYIRARELILDHPQYYISSLLDQDPPHLKKN